MGTGIVPVALSLDGDETLSRTLLVIAAPMWVTLAVLVPMRAGRDRVRFLADQQSSRAGAVTAVGVERGRPVDWSLELTADVAAGESEMTRRVRQRQLDRAAGRHFSRLLVAHCDHAQRRPRASGPCRSAYVRTGQRRRTT
jgi:hypothetical protein